MLCMASLRVTYDCQLSVACNCHTTSPVMSRLTSSFTCQLVSVIITTLIIHHSFTLSLQAQNLPFQQILPTLILLLPWTAFTTTGQDRTYMLLGLFLVRFCLAFLFVPCNGVSWLHVGFLLHVTYTLYYRIILGRCIINLLKECDSPHSRPQRIDLSDMLCIEPFCSVVVTVYNIMLCL